MVVSGSALAQSAAFRAQYAPYTEVPVMVGPIDPILDPTLPGNICGTIKVDSFVSVRAGPGIHYRELDRVHNGQALVICGDSDQLGLPHGWFSVVYEKGGDAYEDKKCWPGGLTKWKTKYEYRGPCGFGWVSQKYVGNLSG